MPDVEAGVVNIHLAEGEGGGESLSRAGLRTETSGRAPRLQSRMGRWMYVPRMSFTEKQVIGALERKDQSNREWTEVWNRGCRAANELCLRQGFVYCGAKKLDPAKSKA